MADHWPKIARHELLFPNLQPDVFFLHHLLQVQIFYLSAIAVVFLPYYSKIQRQVEAALDSRDVLDVDPPADRRHGPDPGLPLSARGEAVVAPGRAMGSRVLRECGTRRGVPRARDRHRAAAGRL